MRKSYFPKYQEAKELYANNPEITLREVCKIVGIKSPDGLSKNLKKDGILIRANQNRVMNEDVFNSINTEEKAYWLGFLYADGNVSNLNNEISISLKSEDIRQLEQFKSFVESNNVIRYKTVTLNENKHECVSFSFCSKKIKNDLIKLGCVPKKSLILKFPTKEQVPNHLLTHFMRGYIDGDGSVICTDKTLCINFISTENFIKSFCSYFNLPINSLGKVGFSGNKRWQTYDRKNIIYLVDTLYDNANIYLKRKYDIAMKIKELPFYLETNRIISG